jgi:hypothetical protein
MCCLSFGRSVVGSDNESWETDSTPSSSSSDEPSRGPIPDAPPLLPVPADVSRSGNELCDTCKLLKLNPKRFVVLPGDKEWKKPNQPDDLSISFGNVADIIVKGESCPLCRIVLEALGGDKVPAFDGGEPVRVDLSWNTDGPRPDASAPWSHVPGMRGS